jgi:hypothetical protein
MFWYNLKSAYNSLFLNQHPMFMKKGFLIPMIFVGFFSVNTIFAAGPFIPNQTLDPNCNPGDSNCIVQLNFLTGSKISSLNSLTWDIQTFAVGTTGTGFNIQSSGNTHTFHIPFATGWVSGLLKGTDWNIFNNKQNTLTAGAGIDITGNTISSTNTSGWQLGGNSWGWQVIGSNDSTLPFMSNGNTMMQLDSSNLSLSYNQSFVDNHGRNGLFIGNHNTYGDSENVLGIWDTLDIRDGNINIFTLWYQVDHIENNQNAFFWGEIVSGMAGNRNFFSFWNENSYSDNTDSVFFGFKNNWNNQIYKFSVGSNGKRWFQVDIDNWEVLFADNAWTFWQALISQWAGLAPQWQDLPSYSWLTWALNGLWVSGNNVQLGGTLLNDTVITHAGKRLTFDLSSINTQNGITMGANILTTGTILNIDSSYNLLNSTNGLLRVANTSASSSWVLARFQANSTPDSGVTFLTNGNVGIADSSPTALFTVGSGDLFQINSAGFAFAPWGTAGAPSYSFVADPDTGMYRPTNNSLRFAAGGNTIGRMDTSGWMLGDGGTAPVSLVHIGWGGSNSTFRMTNNTSGNTASDWFFINFTGTWVSLNNIENADMSFWTNNTEKMRILANGNVGIWTTNPGTKFEVNGVTKSTSFDIGYESVSNTCNTIDNNTACVANCTWSKKVLSWGCFSNTSIRWTLPNGSNNGWVCYHWSAWTDNVIATAICWNVQ